MLKAVRYFRSYLEGSTFKLFTDHEALTFLLKMTEPKGKITRWINELQQFDFEVSHRPGASLKDADAMSRLLLTSSVGSPEVVNSSKLWEGTEQLELGTKGKFHVPSTMVPQILELYHTSPESGGHDGFWRAYMKLTKRFTWPHMKDDTRLYIKSCHECQMYKVKYRQPTDQMTLPEHSSLQDNLLKCFTLTSQR